MTNQQKLNIEDRAKNRAFRNNFGTVIKSLPFMYESNLSAKINELLFRNENDLRVYFTSGTTKRPKAVYADSNDISNVADYIKWFCEVEGIAGGETVAVIMDHSFWAAGPLTCLGHILAGNSVIPIDLRAKDAIAEVLNSVSPTVISTLPSKLEEFADIIPKESLKAVETTGEPMSVKQKDKFKQIYNTEIFDAYGLTEGVIGVECKNHNGYHYKEDKVYLEIKSYEGERILPDNREGEIVMTNLMCRAQPIVRYCTGDAGKIIREKCSCGLSYPRVVLRGRAGKTHYLTDGVKLRRSNVEDIFREVLNVIPLYEIKINNKEGTAYIKINIKNLPDNKCKKIIKKISEANYDVFNLVKTNQLRFIIQFKTHEKENQ